MKQTKHTATHHFLLLFALESLEVKIEPSFCMNLDENTSHADSGLALWTDPKSDLHTHKDVQQSSWFSLFL